MIKLLRTLILRPLRRDLLRTVLTILAVALGVAVVVAIDLAGDAATGSFRSSMETLTGKTDLEIIATGGIDERYMAALTALPFDAHFAPLMEAQMVIPGIGAVPLYGADLAGAPEGAVISKALAQRLPTEIDGTLFGRPLHLKVRQTIEARGEFVVIDIADAQQAMGRFGKLDRIDVTVGAKEDFERVEQAIRAALPASIQVEKPGARSEENQRMLRAFRWNLRVLSYISLVVGAFLIYNTISVSVVRRRAEIGILRAIGAARATILALFLAEALLFGIVGATLGVFLGRALAGGAVHLIADTVNALYTTSRPAPVQLTAWEAWSGILTGALVALASALGPAREAMEVAPTEAMSRGAREHQSRLHWRRGLAGSAILGALALAASQAAPIGGSPIGGYIAALLAIGAAAMAAPAIVLAVNRAARGVVRGHVAGLLASRSLTASLSRTSVVVAALAAAIAMMASVGIMVGSFRETVALWLDTQLRADIYVKPAGPSSAGDYPPLPQAAVEALRATAGVAAVDLFHGMPLHFRGESATLGAGDMDIVRRYGRMRFLPGEDRDAILRSLRGQDRALVSEPFANKHRVRAGDRLSIPMGEHNVIMTVAGIYYEYSSSQGYIILDRGTLLKYLPGQPPTNAALYLSPGVDRDAVLRDVQLRTADFGVSAAPNQTLRRGAIEIFDRTFAITWALEAVAVVVAMLGAANSLLALVLDRRRELGLLRYLGAATSQIRGMILAEAALLGLLALLLGLALGIALSLLLVFVVNKQSFGWTIQFRPPYSLLSAALLLVWCVTVLAGAYPAWVAARINPIDVVHEE
ncbi:MAG: ABC transporter permease [Candidatus Solibacter sp.]